jgi:hypothetical protein
MVMSLKQVYALVILQRNYTNEISKSQLKCYSSSSADSSLNVSFGFTFIAAAKTKTTAAIVHGKTVENR